MQGKIIICGTNWLGDSVMSMPAVQRFRVEYPGSRVTMLVKPKLCGLWEMHSGVDSVLDLQDGVAGLMRTVGLVRAGCFDAAYVFPNSFRSALIPFLAGIPVRRGVAGHQRSWLLTDVVRHCGGDVGRHQAWEYYQIMGLAGRVEEPGQPELAVPAAAGAMVADLLGGRGSRRGWIGLLPGAAYGPAKRWPAEYFIEAGRSLAAGDGYDIVVAGSVAEAGLCAEVAAGIGAAAVNLAGKTTLSTLAALLAACRGVITNDSGGMHLAAAAGTGVVAVFGITDFTRTGPLGRNCRIVFDEGVERSRDIARDSAEAAASLRAIKPERVCAQLRELLAGMAD